MKHTLKSVRAIAVAIVTFGSLAGGVNGAIVTFNLGNSGSGTTFQIVSSGVTATFSDPEFNSSTTAFVSDMDGLLIFNQGSFGNMDSFSIAFSEPIRLISYQVGYTQDLGGNESVSITDGVSNTTISNFAAGSAINFPNQFITSSALSFSATNNDSGELAQFSAITVETIPEPSSTLLFGLAALGFMARRSKS